MWTITAQHIEAHVRVRVSRWQRGERYPVDLCEFELVDAADEPELALMERVAVAAARECAARRREQQTEGWGRPGDR